MQAGNGERQTVLVLERATLRSDQAADSEAVTVKATARYRLIGRQFMEIARRL